MKPRLALRSRKDILARIKEIDEELVSEEKRQPFNFRADEFLRVLAEGQEITDECIASLVRGFLSDDTVNERLALLKEKVVLERRLETWDRMIKPRLVA